MVVLLIISEVSRAVSDMEDADLDGSLRSQDLWIEHSE